MAVLVEGSEEVKRRVDVTVMGLPLSVRTERDDAWVHGLANTVTRRLEELKRGAKNASAQQLAVLLALNMAEELQLEREKNAALSSDLSQLATTTLSRVQAALAALDEADDEEEDEEEAEEVVGAEA